MSVATPRITTEWEQKQKKTVNQGKLEQYRTYFIIKQNDNRRIEEQKNPSKIRRKMSLLDWMCTDCCN